MNKAHFHFIEGELLLINKPLHWTSFQVVNKLRGIINRSVNNRVKVGHAGTLDPLATGLLIICTGKMTKKIDEYQAQQKEYTGIFTLGGTTPCYDLEKPVDTFFPTDHITNEMIADAARSFLGKSMQTAPIFSAKKIEGERAYEKARRGEAAIIPPREVEIMIFEITNIKMPEVHFRIVCSKGTYIRSIANDLGKRLNSGAHLSSLCRTAIGEYKLSDAMSTKDFEEQVTSQQAL